MTYNWAKISSYLNLITGLIKAFVFYGLSTASYFVILILVQNGHFCDTHEFEKYLQSQTNTSQLQVVLRNETLMNSKYYQNCVSDQQKSIGSILSTLPIFILSLFGLLYGLVVDRFRVLFVRSAIIVLYLFGLFCLAQITLQSEIYVYIAIILISMVNGLLMIEATRDVPQAVPKLENITRSICLGLQLGTGFFYSLINKYFIGVETRFEDPNYFWNIQNFSYVMMALCGVIMIPRTLIWLRGKYGGQYEFKRTNHHQFFDRYSVNQHGNFFENRNSVLENYNATVNGNIPKQPDNNASRVSHFSTKFKSFW